MTQQIYACPTQCWTNYIFSRNIYVICHNSIIVLEVHQGKSMSSGSLISSLWRSDTDIVNSDPFAALPMCVCVLHLKLQTHLRLKQFVMFINTLFLYSLFILSVYTLCLHSLCILFVYTLCLYSLLKTPEQEKSLKSLSPWWEAGWHNLRGFLATWFDPESFPHSAYVKIFATFATKSAVF